jgi:hypothetical protein
MKRMLLALLVIVAGCGPAGRDGGSDVDAAAAVPDAPAIPDFTFTKTAVGSPAWDVGAPVQLSTTVGTMADNFADAHTSFLREWPDHQYDSNYNIYSTKTPHQPPYDAEMSAHLTDIKVGTEMTLADWTSPTGIAVMMIVFPTAAAPIGNTFDGVLPMIPNTVFPLDTGADLLRAGTIVDPNFNSSYPPSTKWAPGTDGYSHVPLVFFETTEFLTPQTSSGEFSWTFRLRDQTGAGYDLTAGPLVVN